MGDTTTQQKIDFMNEDRVFYDIRSKQPFVVLLKANCHYYFCNMRQCSYHGRVDQRDQIESVNKTVAVDHDGVLGRSNDAEFGRKRCFALASTASSKQPKN